jgi:hypothetical protein
MLDVGLDEFKRTLTILSVVFTQNWTGPGDITVAVAEFLLVQTEFCYFGV